MRDGGKQADHLLLYCSNCKKIRAIVLATKKLRSSRGGKYLGFSKRIPRNYMPRIEINTKKQNVRVPRVLATPIYIDPRPSIDK